MRLPGRRATRCVQAIANTANGTTAATHNAIGASSQASNNSRKHGIARPETNTPRKCDQIDSTISRSEVRRAARSPPRCRSNQPIGKRRRWSASRSRASPIMA